MSARREAWRAARRRLADHLHRQRQGRPFWQGRLSDSALATATAVGALALADASAHGPRIAAGADWLEATQNADGGWGDSPDSPSNLSTTALAAAALPLAGRTVNAAARRYLDSFGPFAPAILHAYGDDRSFSAPILTFCAIAGQADWADVPQLPFELAALPQGVFRFLRLSVVSYALPALIAIGLARFARGPAGGRLRAALRRALTGPALRRLTAIQPESGGYLEAIPLSSFVAMNLIAAGRGGHVVAERCLAFVGGAQRPSGAWPIDVDLATWNTTMAVHALGGELGDAAAAVRDWLLARQADRRHPYTGSPSGGWGWTHHSGSVPDADDTAGALLALAALPACEASARAAEAGAQWLLGLQNADGGWPTFCRGWGRLEFDRSGCDLTAHALRALHAWRARWPRRLARRADKAIARGLAFLAGQQRPDGAWLPLWFASQATGDQANPVFGTARVLLAYNDLKLHDSPPAKKAAACLLAAAHPAGGWGADRGIAPTAEETAVAVEALTPWPAADARAACAAGADWLAARVDGQGELAASPIGLYFARLWYAEALYPISMAAAALRAVDDVVEPAG